MADSRCVDLEWEVGKLEMYVRAGPIPAALAAGITKFIDLHTPIMSLRVCSKVVCLQLHNSAEVNPAPSAHDMLILLKGSCRVENGTGEG